MKNLLQLHYTLETIGSASEKFWAELLGYRIFAFNGEMGAGKTTFIHKLCDYLKVEDVVSSPTFALINEYHFRDKNAQDQTIYHLDWYRLKDANEAISAGMEDCLIRAQQNEAYCFIEWPEKAAKLLSTPYVNIIIETLSPAERVMNVELI